jgi:hypothetical protein
MAVPGPLLRDAGRDLRGRAWLPGGVTGAAEDAGVVPTFMPKVMR